MDNLVPGERIIRSLSKASEWVARGSVVGVMSVTCVNSVLRLFGLPIPGDFDFVMLLGAMTVCFALPYCTLHKGHTTVELFVSRLPKRIRAVIDIFTGILSVCFFSFVCWQFFGYATVMLRSGEITHTARLPFFPFLYIASIMFVLFCFVLALSIVKSIKKLVRP